MHVDIHKVHNLHSPIVAANRQPSASSAQGKVSTGHSCLCIELVRPSTNLHDIIVYEVWIWKALLAQHVSSYSFQVVLHSAHQNLILSMKFLCQSIVVSDIPITLIRSLWLNG